MCVAAGQNHSLAVTDTGALLTWGKGEGGRLGHGEDQANKLVPTGVEGAEGVVGVAAGVKVSLISTGAAGAVRSFGADNFVLGLGEEVKEALVPTEIEGLAVGLI